MSIKSRVIHKLLLEDKLKENDIINCEVMTFHIRYGRQIIYHNIIPTLTTKCCFFVVIGDEMNKLKIRRLTPRECWRLMGFDDEDFNKAEQVNSNTQLYKQAGNSIVVNVLEGILHNLLK